MISLQNILLYNLSFFSQVIETLNIVMKSLNIPQVTNTQKYFLNLGSKVSEIKY